MWAIILCQPEPFPAHELSRKFALITINQCVPDTAFKVRYNFFTQIAQYNHTGVQMQSDPSVLSEGSKRTCKAGCHKTVFWDWLWCMSTMVSTYTQRRYARNTSRPTGGGCSSPALSDRISTEGSAWPANCTVLMNLPLRGKLVNTVQHDQDTGHSLWYYIMVHVLTRQLKFHVTFSFPLQLQSTQDFSTL